MFEFVLGPGAQSASSPRRGRFHTPHAVIETPVFMPVGTQATVKAMTQDELEAIGFPIILGNTYHLYLRPGPDLIERAGGLHRFMSWGGAILTDSGGFQVFSLAALRTIQDDGVCFRSYLDGSEHLFTPESVIEIQQAIGADIIMAFDECAPFPCSEEDAGAAMRRTHRWAARCKTRWLQGDTTRQALFPIVQGSFYRTLRTESARAMSDLDLPGVAIGGVSVGEPAERSREVIEWTAPLLPADRPRYLMGVGTPEDILEAVERGIDMFDCVLPTRLGRNGSVYTSRGRLNLRIRAFAEDSGPIDPACQCPTCTRYSAAYLRHLYRADEILAARLATYHNLYFYQSLMSGIRDSIECGTFDGFKRTFLERFRAGAAGPTKPEGAV
ncbi:MAG: tRNA guanosine(34) transglycosylase Tgt [Chloroflexi bacterium]|nr:tRNA guanosine(34) transglycosylase Tgt [Chloroflexota bacterium]